MLGRAGDDLGEVALEVGQALLGRAEDEVQRDRVEAGGASGRERAPGLVAAVGAAQALERAVVEALHAERHAAHARVAKAAETLALEGPGIHLERRLDGRPGREGGPHGVDDAGQRGRAQQRGRPSPQIEAREGPPGEGPAAGLELAQERVHVGLLRRGLQAARRHHREVAIGAHPLAEGNVHVHADVHARRVPPAKLGEAVTLLVT